MAEGSRSNVGAVSAPLAVQTPPGWAKAERPLTVALLGWARLSLQAREGSGYNLNASDLAIGLAMSGHKVYYMRSGMDYSIRRSMYYRHFEDWRGISCWDFVNSPNLSPASSNFRNMPAEMSSPEHSRRVIEWLDKVGAEVVHIHSLEGYSLDIIEKIRATGRPVVVTAHNHWYVCPQVDLLHEEKRVCLDYQGGQKCVGCLDAPRPHRRRLYRSLETSAHNFVGPELYWLTRGIVDFVKRRVKAIGKKTPPPVKIDPPRPMWDELALGFDVPAGQKHAGLIDQGLPLTKDDQIPELGRADIDTNEKFLKADHHLNVINEYGKRRLAGVDAVNHASLVTPPSKFVLETLHTMGLRRELGRHVLLGQPHFDALNRRARRSPFYSARPWDPKTATRPLRFGFFGTTRNNKGLAVLVNAIPLLSHEVRQRCQFYIRAAGWDWSLRKKLSVYPEVAFGGGYDMLQLCSSGGEFDVGILPHVWFENSPLVLLEMLHAGKFVISSRLGGPPEWIVEPGTDRQNPLGNGLLFPGGSPEDLARHITRVATGEVVVPSASEVHAVTRGLQSYPGHIAEVESIYRELLAIDQPAPVKVEVRAGTQTHEHAQV